MCNLNIDKTYTIVSDKVLFLKNNLAGIEFEYPKKKCLSTSEFTEYLQMTYFSIEQNIESTCDYIESNHLSNRRFENLKRISKQLIEMQTIIANDLFKLGSTRNNEFEDFYNDIIYDISNTNLIQNPNNKQLNDFNNYIAEIRNLSTPQLKPKNNHEQTLWFRVGLLFATGEIEKLIEIYSSNATQISISLGNKSFRPYITESISKSTVGNKNIFSNRNKMQKITDYCKKHNIIVTPEFLKELNNNKL